jgi:hypothetical protein
MLSPKVQNAIIRKLATDEITKQRRDWMERCVSAITASIAADLLDKYGWTPYQVSELLASSNSAFESMLAGFATIDDYKEWIKERGIIV